MTLRKIAAYTAVVFCLLAPTGLLAQGKPAVNKSIIVYQDPG